MAKQYTDKQWVTITIEKTKGEKPIKLVIGCSNMLESAHIEANFEDYVRILGRTTRKTASQRKPKIDGRKFKEIFLSRSQAEKKYPALFERPNKVQLDLAINYEIDRKNPYFNQNYVEEQKKGANIPPQFIKQAKALLSKVKIDYSNLSQYKQSQIVKSLMKK